MRRNLLFIILLCCLVYPIFSYTQNHMPANSSDNTKDWSQVQKIFKQKGIQQGNTIRINFARTDLDEKLNEIPMDSNLALGGYVAFTPMQDHAMMMCTMVLLQKEVEPVIEQLIANNIEITGLHNHLCGENPKIVFLHCTGHGDAAKLAKGFKSALDKTQTPLLQKNVYPKSNINWQDVESILGFKGQKQGNMILFSIPRADKVYQMDAEMSLLMGVGETINMQKVGNKAISVGDFVLTAHEVNPVIKALTSNEIKVTSIHNHMLDENPRTFCLHYWGYSNPDKLAKGLRAALNEINIVETH